MRKWLALVALAIVVCPAFAAEPAAPTSETNPFFVEWTTPFGVPPFADIEDDEFLPAFREGIGERWQEVEAIVSDPEPPSFANTVVALERSGSLLAKVSGVFYNLLSAETNDQLQAVAREVAPELSALRDDIALHPDLFARVATVYERRDSLELSTEQRTLLEESYRRFVRGGANLQAEEKERLRAINSELAVLGLRFGENLLAETNGYRLVIENAEDLAGLAESTIAAAADAARDAGLGEGWMFTLHSPSIWPFLSSADNRDLRRAILTAYITRADHGDEHDNNALLAKMAAMRAEKASLLGYDSWAHFVLEERMAKTPAAVYGLLWRLWTPALAVAKEEAAALQAMIREEGGELELQPWDWRYYADKVRKARYDLDEEALRPYFGLDNVRDGAFWVANRLFGLSFVERTDISTYHPNVRSFEVRDADGSHLGVLMLDYHPRPGKRGGAWSSRYRGQWIENGRDVRPVIVNVGNFSPPAGDLPALLTLEEVQTLFHEFGHALHQLLSRCHYRSLSGTSVARDFVELPSQIMENWLWEPEVLKVYARHHDSGEVIPDELVAKVKASRRFNQGFTTVEYLAASFLDMDWHTLVEPVVHDPEIFDKQSLTRIGLPPEIVVRYRSPYFSHIFGGTGGYSAGYYSYIWSEVLDADAYQAFKENGILDPATARTLRSNILERGGTEDPMVLYTRFRGHEPSVQPLLERRGLK